MEQTPDIQIRDEGDEMMTLPTHGNHLTRLPSELRIAIFEQLPDQKSINALAAAYPELELVLKKYENRIHKAMRRNFMAGVAKDSTGYESLYLARLALMWHALLEDVPLQRASAILSDAWEVSDKDLAQLEIFDIRTLLDECQMASMDLNFLGFFNNPEPQDIDQWYTQVFCSAEPIYLQTPPGEPTYYNNTFTEVCHEVARHGARLDGMEIHMIAEVWCWHWENQSLHEAGNDWSRALSAFLGLFSPEIAWRVRRYAWCCIRGMYSPCLHLY
jgi:hypothetical protein